VRQLRDDQKWPADRSDARPVPVTAVQLIL
jgi:hypothetical protein